MFVCILCAAYLWHCVALATRYDENEHFQPAAPQYNTVRHTSAPIERYLSSHYPCDTVTRLASGHRRISVQLTDNLARKLYGKSRTS